MQFGWVYVKLDITSSSLLSLSPAELHAALHCSLSLHPHPKLAYFNEIFRWTFKCAVDRDWYEKIQHHHTLQDWFNFLDLIISTEKSPYITATDISVVTKVRRWNLKSFPSGKVHHYLQELNTNLILLLKLKLNILVELFHVFPPGHLSFKSFTLRPCFQISLGNNATPEQSIYYWNLITNCSILRFPCCNESIGPVQWFDQDFANIR